MNDELCFLVQLLRDGELLKVAIKLKNDQVSYDPIEFSKDLLKHLPSYLQDGEVVEVIEIHDTLDARPLPKECTETPPREEPTLVVIQREQKAWALENFGEQLPHRALLGAVEELGELVEADPSSTSHIVELVKALGRLSHSQLKGEQGIRINKDHEVLAKDAVADMIIFLVSYCNDKGFDIEDIVKETWDKTRRGTGTRE